MSSNIVGEKRILSIGSTKKTEDLWKLTFERVKRSNTSATESIVEQGNIGIEELGSDLVSRHTILVEGFTGTGKTTMIQLLVENNCLDTYRIILHIQLNSTICRKIKTTADIAKELSLSLAELELILQDAGNGLLIVLDGAGDLFKTNDWESTVLAGILLGKNFPSSTKLLLTRPSGVLLISSHVQMDYFYRIQGLSDPKVDLLPRLDSEVTKLCEQHPVLLSMCKIPLIAKLLCAFCERSKQQASCTLANVCIYVITEIVKGRLEQVSYGFTESLDLFSLPEEVFDEFSKLCKFSYESLASKHLLESIEQKQRFVSGFTLTGTYSLATNETFGLVETTFTGDTSQSSSFQFIHLLVQEFLAGYYIQLLPPLDQLDLLYKHAPRMLARPDPSYYWLILFFGLVWRRKLTFDPTKYMISTLLEFLTYHLTASQHDVQGDNALFTLLLCVAETRDDELWKKFVTSLGGDYYIQLSVDSFVQHMWTVANMLNCSGIRDWNVTASNFDICRELQNFELYTSAAVSKHEVFTMNEFAIQISPKLSIEAVVKRRKDSEKFEKASDKTATITNYYQCRAIREILQRIFKIYSVLKLKGDASNPAYVSFLSCECFKKRMKDSMQFDPCIAYHFLEVTSKKTLKMIQEENKAHLATHDGKAIELVILLKPYLRRVTLTVPHTIEKQCIILMSEELAQTVISEGAISSSLSTVESSEASNVHFEETSSPTSLSEMVRPGLPLPSKSELSGRASTIVPQMAPLILEATPVPTPHPIVHASEHQDEVHHHVSTPSRGEEVQPGNASYGSGFTYSPHFQGQQPTTSEFQPTTTVTPSQQAPHTRSSIKPGTILFTSTRARIPADHIHPLPDESHQIRRGGNGQIFQGSISGMNVVYKKTNYRSKEYAIITKIKHSNVVKLLAFMYGEENPAHKRRHFCYHIMPQMSGDCARMLTDKRELTIKELHKKYGDNIRKMGIIRGNLKYLLKQILQGLRYLHSLHIAHRDIKGSNILLKFDCSCSNPLECGCDSKYLVQICDFDAAVELDENEQLPPTQFGSRTSSRPSHTQYVCVPVGTTGFRSPECSMLVITGTPDAFSPPITTRSDIWSLGILTLKMLIGTNGPGSQRQMALLLLHYYRQRYVHEGLHKTGHVEVDRLVTDQLLNVSQNYMKHLTISPVAI
jgi:thymidylate kinase